MCSIKPGNAEEGVLCFGLPRASGHSGRLCERTFGVNVTFLVARGAFELLLALNHSDDCHSGVLSSDLF